MADWKSEEQLAAVVVAWLQDMRWTVYQEVQIRMCEPIADIVAINEQGLAWIIETKRTFGFKVVDQANQWIGAAHYVSVAVPSRQGRLTRTEIDVLKWLGIGCLYVYDFPSVSEQVPPRLHRRIRFDDIRKHLTEKHKTFASAGNAQGARLTPFQNTCDEIYRQAVHYPGITLKTLLSKITTHYCNTTTAKSCIVKWGSQGIIKGTEFKKENGVWRIYPKKE